MSAIGKGDWVECIQNRLPTTQPPIGLVVGRVYRVEAVGVTGPDDQYPNTPWVRVFGAHVREGRDGFRLAWFKPVYAPNADLIERLKQPAPPETVEV